MKNCSMYEGVQCTQVFNLTGSTVKQVHDNRLMMNEPIELLYYQNDKVSDIELHESNTVKRFSEFY